VYFKTEILSEGPGKKGERVLGSKESQSPRTPRVMRERGGARARMTCRITRKKGVVGDKRGQRSVPGGGESLSTCSSRGNHRPDGPPRAKSAKEHVGTRYDLQEKNVAKGGQQETAITGIVGLMRLKKKVTRATSPKRWVSLRDLHRRRSGSSSRARWRTRRVANVKGRRRRLAVDGPAEKGCSIYGPRGVRVVKCVCREAFRRSEGVTGPLRRQSTVPK